MAKTVKFGVEVVDHRVWGFVSPSCGDPSETPVNEVLRWILEQLNFGNCEYSQDGNGRVTSLTIGSDAADDADTVTVEEVADYVRSRLQAVNVAGVFARGREEGLRPEASNIAETVRMTATDAAYNNTEKHYAFEFFDILARIRASTFIFTSPPIHGTAAPAVVALLREALCRALLEAALRDRVNPSELLSERWRTKKGELECLINIGTRRRILTPKLSEQAHAIRKAGNQALHGKEPADAAAWGVLLDTRAVVEVLCSSG
jgi:hypothetical protein